MTTTNYDDATAIKQAKKTINNLLAKLVSNQFTPVDLQAIYTGLGESYDDYRGKIYTSAPAVSFTGGGGTGATATASIAAGLVDSVTVTAPGTGYTSPPDVVFTGGGGAGTVGVATLSGTGVDTVAVDNQSLTAKLYAKIAELDADFLAL